MFAACWDQLLGDVLVATTTSSTNGFTLASSSTTRPSSKPRGVTPKPVVVLSRDIMRDVLSAVWDRGFMWIASDDDMFRGEDPMPYIDTLVAQSTESRMGFVRRKGTASEGAPPNALGVAFHVIPRKLSLPPFSKETCDVLLECMGRDADKRLREDAVIVDRGGKNDNKQKRPSLRRRDPGSLPPRKEVFRTNKHIVDILMDACTG